MWLVDFKLDFLNDVENGGHKYRRAPDNEEEPCTKKLKLSEEYKSFSPQDDPYPSSPINLSFSNISSTNETSSLTSLSQQNDDCEPQPVPIRAISSAKPNYTYTDLITLALKDKTSLTVSGIYQWIT